MTTSKYGWVIDRDYLPDGNRSWVFGPRNLDPVLRRKLVDGSGKEFTLYDDDKILYYKGRIVGEYDGFEPLDDYGAPNAGCTEIRYDGVTL